MSYAAGFRGCFLVLKPPLVPKPQLGNALAGEAPASRDGRRPEAGASGADAFPSRGLGTRKPRRSKAQILSFRPEQRFAAGEPLQRISICGRNDRKAHFISNRSQFFVGATPCGCPAVAVNTGGKHRGLPLHYVGKNMNGYLTVLFIGADWRHISEYTSDLPSRVFRLRSHLP